MRYRSSGVLDGNSCPAPKLVRDCRCPVNCKESELLGGRATDESTGAGDRREGVNEEKNRRTKRKSKSKESKRRLRKA